MRWAHQCCHNHKVPHYNESSANRMEYRITFFRFFFYFNNLQLITFVIKIHITFGLNKSLESLFDLPLLSAFRSRNLLRCWFSSQAKFPFLAQFSFCFGEKKWESFSTVSWTLLFSRGIPDISWDRGRWSNEKRFPVVNGFLFSQIVRYYSKNNRWNMNFHFRFLRFYNWSISNLGIYTLRYFCVCFSLSADFIENDGEDWRYLFITFRSFWNSNIKKFDNELELLLYK